ncbi:hypothetical protein F5890DRAFT_416206 [Lentinula detonsa]|uniref:F-box domain-containing protein n=1 Tax=Lentinula detonsa TaxID=2804962 RepID=A0AA38PUR9_9AGAR|nr:hypothetical protein F5890DRAFT_416206 [Lentinula detonsa]
MANLNDEVAIYQFPFEVFHSIFGYLVSEDRHQLEAGTSQKPIASFTISQVSQRWRDIALGLPFIWTNIRIFHFCDSQRAMVKELLVRTKGLPLSITLKYNKPLTAAQNKNCWDILLEIMSCASRWETLRIAVNEDLFAQICGNFGGRQAPILQRLELIILGFGKWQPHRRMSPFIVSPLYLELSHTHLLRHLVLFGVRLRMPSPTYMEKLEVLSLDYTPGMDMLDRPSLPAESPPLQTRLRDLSLRGLVFRNLPTRSYLSEYTAFLTTLSLSNMFGHQSADVTTLFKHLPTITLREFSLLDVDFAFWNGFLNSMVGPDPRYPAVEKLCLQNTLEEYSVPITQLPLTDFIQGFPKLEILNLYNVHHITNSLKQCAIFPCIHTLRVRGLRYRDLCEVDTPPLLDLSSLSWLQRKVPNFKRDPMDKAY